MRIEPLESRILYSADSAPLATLLGNNTELDDTTLAVQQLDYSLLELLDSVQHSGPLPNYTEIVVIDSSVPEQQLIIDEFAHSEHTLVVSLSETENGLDTLGTLLKGLQNVQAIQIFTHSDGNSFQLGSAIVDNESMQANESKLSLWQNSLESSADILIYGCNLAATESGQQLLNDLASITGADVAASEDLSGHESKGANWDLEFRTGIIDTDNLLANDFADNWEHILATINVTTNADTNDGDTSSIAQLLANQGADGLVSLREAITAANNTGGLDHIRLVADTYILKPGNGDIEISDAITITGDDLTTTTIDGSNATRIFDIQNADTTIRDLTLANGFTTGNGGAIQANGGKLILDQMAIDGSGSGARGGAMMVSNSPVEITDSIFENNTSAGNGGAIFLSSTAPADITGSTFVSNTSGDDGGAIISTGNLFVRDSQFDNNKANDDGSAIHTSGSAFVSSSSFTLNTTTGGGGTVINYGALKLTSSYFFDNTAGSSGGGVHNNSSATITDSTFHMNKATTFGGAIGINANGNTDISNSTFYLNNANDSGGAIGSVLPDAILTGSHLTFSSNQAGGSGGAVYAQSTSTSISNSIFDSNSASNSFDQIDGNYSNGFNLFTNNPNTVTTLGDIVNGNAALGPLQDNGGPVPTMMLQNFSDAIDSGSGRSRIDAIGNNSNEFPDIGAVEFLSSGTTNKVYWTDEDGQAIYRANESGTTTPILWAIQKIVDTTNNPTDIEYHLAQERLYWAETNGAFGRIVSSDLDGQNQVIAIDNSNDPELLEPYGIALDEVNNTIYATSNLNALNVDGTGLQKNTIRQYSISGNAANGYTYAFEAVIHAANSDDPNPIADPKDIEYIIDPLSGDAWLGWTDISFGVLPIPMFSVVNLDSPPTDLAYFPFADTTVIPQGVAWNTNTGLAYIADVQNNLTAVTYDPATGTANITIAPSGTRNYTAGIHYDPARDMVWYTRVPDGNSAGSIWTANSLLQNHSQAQGSINDPTAITLAAASQIEQNFDLVIERPTVQEFSSVVLQNTDLAAIDPDTNAGQLIFSVTLLPSHGQLEFVSNPGIAIVSFTQDQINNGQVVYVHTGALAARDEFVFDVTDGTYSKTQQLFTINIDIVNDAPVAGDATSMLWENASTTIFEYNSLTFSNLTDLVSDTDPGDLLTFSLNQQASAGTATINTDGTFVYTHGTNEQFVDSFSYLVTDLFGASDTGTITLSVNAINDISPVAVNDTLTVNEGASTSLLTGSATSVLDNDYDLDIPAQILQASLLTGAAYDAQSGVATINPDGTFTYQHDGSETLSDRFYYTVTDFVHAPVIAWVDVTVVAQNDNVPFVPSDLIRLNEGDSSSAFTGGRTSLTDGFSDLDLADTQANAMVTLSNGPSSGTLVLGANQTFTYTHDGSETFTDSFDYLVTDTGGNSVTVTASIQIVPVNENSPFVADNTVTVDEGGNATEFDNGLGLVTDGWVDEDFDDTLLNISVSLVSDVTFGTLTLNPNNTFSYSHDGSENFADSFVYRLTDTAGNAHEVTTTIQINPVNEHAPFVADNTLTLHEGDTTSQFDDGLVRLTDGWIDTDFDDTLSNLGVSIVSAPSFGTLNINPDYTFDYTHDGSENFADSFVYRLTDSVGNTHDVTATIQINPVNEHSPFVADNTVILDEGGTATQFHDGLTRVTDGWVDEDFDDTLLNISVSLVSDVTFGTLTLNPNNTFSYSHDGSENFADSFVYRLTDTAGNTHDVINTIQINPVNEHSPFVADNTLTLNEGDSSAQFDNGLSQLTDGWIDDDFDDTLLNVGVALVSTPSFGNLTINADNTFNYTHDGSENFTDSYVYRLTDTAGNTHDTTITIQINPVNEHTPYVADNFLTLDEGGSTAQFDNGFLRLTDSWTDDDFDDTFLNVTVSLISAPSFGILTINPDNTFDYSHNDSENFSDGFIYRLTDTAGNIHDTTTTIQINPINEHHPFIADNSLTVDEGASASTLDNGFINLLDGLVDADTADTSSTVGISLISSPLFGNLTINPDRTFNYTHDGSENFTDSYIYRLTDTSGNTHDTTVNIQINSVNEHIPFVADSTLTVNEGASTQLLDNGFSTLTDGLIDADTADTPASVSINLVSSPLHGSLAINNDNTFSYTHDGSENFTDSFIYQLTDTAGNIHNTTVNIQVNSINNPPVTGNSTVTATEDTDYIFSVNDFVFSDPAENHVLNHLIIDTIPAAGILSVSSIDITPGSVISVSDIQNGNMRYSPIENTNGPAQAQFTYLVVDNGGSQSGGTDTSLQAAVLSIDIEPINDDPVVTGNISDINIAENSSLSSSLPTSLFSDADNDLLAIELTMVNGSPLPAWITYQPASGILILNPTAEEIGTHTLAISATDNQGGEPATTTFILNVTDVNYPATAIDPTTVELNENADGILITPLTVIDADIADMHILQVDDPRFEIVNNELWLKPGNSLDYENEPSVALIIEVTDGNITSNFPLLLEVLDLNDPPIAAVESIDLTATAGETISLADLVFTDQDQPQLDRSVTLTDGSPLPAWLSFFAPTSELIFIGEPEAWASEDGINIVLTATDSQGSSDSTIVSIALSPALAAALPDPQDPIEMIEEVHNSVATTVAPAEVAPTPEESSEITSDESAATEPEPIFSKNAAVSTTNPAIVQLAQPITVAERVNVVSNEYPIPERNTDVERVENRTSAPPQIKPIEISLARLMQPQLLNSNFQVNLAKQLDTPMQSLEERRITVERIETVSFGVTTSVSVGYILWVIRSGAVLTSLVTALPAWRAIDPLPVLASLDVEDDSDEESLQSMVETDESTPQDGREYAQKKTWWSR